MKRNREREREREMRVGKVHFESPPFNTEPLLWTIRHRRFKRLLFILKLRANRANRATGQFICHGPEIDGGASYLKQVLQTRVSWSSRGAFKRCRRFFAKDCRELAFRTRMTLYEIFTHTFTANTYRHNEQIKYIIILNTYDTKLLWNYWWKS